MSTMGLADIMYLIGVLVLADAQQRMAASSPSLRLWRSPHWSINAQPSPFALLARLRNV